MESVVAPVFREWPKIPRLRRDCVITEKIDGTNGCIHIAEEGAPIIMGSGREIPFLVGSRTRWIFPENDNFGFASWAFANAEELLKLGPGTHYGEWWGPGIQRRYGIAQKRFSLFNRGRWNEENLPTPLVSVVPVVAEGLFSDALVEEALAHLFVGGSLASPGFMLPEGVVVYHTASGHLYKVLLKGDAIPKGEKK